jgi:hypothetical protein
LFSIHTSVPLLLYLLLLLAATHTFLPGTDGDLDICGLTAALSPVAKSVASTVSRKPKLAKPQYGVEHLSSNLCCDGRTPQNVAMSGVEVLRSEKAGLLSPPAQAGELASRKSDSVVEAPNVSSAEENAETVWLRQVRSAGDCE